MSEREGRTDTRRAKGAATRRHLLDVAAALFAEQGYEATSFKDLIAASGLSHGAFYFHFDSKEHLGLEVFRDTQQRLLEAVTARIDPDASGLERFRQLWQARAEVLAADPSLRAIRKIAATFGDHPDRAAELAQFHERPVAFIASMLADARATGDVRDDVDPRQAAEAAFAAAIGIDEVSERTTGGADIVARSQAFLDLFLPGIAAR